MHEQAPLAATERRVYRFFEVAVFLKGLNAVLELVGGLLVLLISPTLVTRVATYFTAAELGEDPHDIIATSLRHVAEAYAATGHTFTALYLLSHGALKLALVVELLKGWARAYPAALMVFGLFVLYQSYVFVHNHSWTVAALTLFDLVVMYFIWREWRVVRTHAAG